MSAAPIGNPEWPDFAYSTASIASARIAFAMRSWWARVMGAPSPLREELATAAVEAFVFMGTCPDGRWIPRAGHESNEWARLPQSHAQLAHVPEKWVPVFRKGHAQD
jgi:hypothetical protein